MSLLKPLRLFFSLSALSLCTLGAGCGGGAFVSGTGSVGEHKFEPIVGYWGGPFMYISNDDVDCMDMGWMEKYPSNGEASPAPTQQGLQITFKESDVVAGTYNAEGASPISAFFLAMDSDLLSLAKAESGVLSVDTLDNEGSAVGSFDFKFADGDISGEFDIEWCRNLKSKL